MCKRKPPLLVALLVCCWLAGGTCLAEESIEIDPLILAAQQQRIDTMRRAAQATVSIFGLDGGGGGSGVLITPDGYTLTNYHVSSACGDHMRCGLNDGQVYDAVIVGIDATGDVSLIKLLGRDDFPTAPLGNSAQVRVGQWCFAAGNPFVLATNLQPSISLGIVSGVNRYQYPAGTLLEYADCIQTDAAINPGNSGGPLFNLAGEVIGINGRCSFEKRGRVNVGVGYAISSNQIKNFMGMLKSGRLVDHATLGATVSTDASGDVRVSNILSNSDAYRRGLRYGDQIISLAGREVRSTNSFKNILGTLPKDWRVPLTIRREGKNQTFLVRLDGVHTEKQLIDLISAEVAPGHTEERKNQKEGGDEDKQTDDNDTSDEESPTDNESARKTSKPAAQKAGKAKQTHELGQPNKALVNSVLKSRAGFANYYFNQLHRQRLWESLPNTGEYAAIKGTWIMRGTIAGETTPIEIRLATDQAEIRVGSRVIELPLNDELSRIVTDRRETGLLLGLHALRQLLQLGPEKLGASTYIGTLPVYPAASTNLADAPLHDMIQSLWYDAKARYYFDPVTKSVSLIEVFGDAGHDPVEVYLDQYIEINLANLEQKFLFPSRLRLQYGAEPMLLVTIDSVLAEPLSAEATAPGGVQKERRAPADQANTGDAP